MKPTYTILRLLLFAGCLAVLVRSPRLPVALATNCSDYSGGYFQEACPSGCTSSTFTNYSYGGSGIYSISPPNSPPCSPSTCSQPGDAVQVPQQDCSNCCLANGQICYSGGITECCCWPSVCSITGSSGVCCAPDGELCNFDNDCCSGVCTDGICGTGGCTGYIGDPCTVQSDCCEGFCSSYSYTCEVS